MTQSSLSSRVAARCWTLALCSGLVGCGPDFDSRMALSGYRMVGVEASPPEVASSGTVSLTAHDFFDGDAELRHEWSLCLHSAGAGDRYRCSQEEISIGEGPSVELEFGADGLDLSTQLDALPPLLGPDGLVRSLERGLDVWVKLNSGPDCPGCEQVETAKRLFVRDADVAPNLNPVIEGLELVGSARRGANVELRVNTNSGERYTDPSSGKSLKEEYLYTWFSSAEAPSPTRTAGSENSTELTLPDAPGPVEVIVAVRDGRGGFATERSVFEVE